MCVSVCLPLWAHQMAPPFPDAGQGRKQDQNRVSVILGLPGPPLYHWAIKTNSSEERLISDTVCVCMSV